MPIPDSNIDAKSSQMTGRIDEGQPAQDGHNPDLGPSHKLDPVCLELADPNLESLIQKWCATPYFWRIDSDKLCASLARYVFSD